MKRMKQIALMLLSLACLGLVACKAEEPLPESYPDATHIVLSDDGITVEGADISSNSEDAVYAANDIVFYLEGQGFTYGEGDVTDEHSQADADAHTVVHITEPGDYHISGTLSLGQIAVDLGEGAAEDPEAKVTLILDNMNLTCSVAPAVIFYNVYECGSTDVETASGIVDTSDAGANVIIADGSTNVVNGSYVARIYKSYELSEDGTEVVDSKKLHKYDGAFYSKQSMNVNGGEEGNGILHINATNEGLDSELHLTINGGWIIISSGNDGINTNEDNVSVTTINGGKLHIHVEGTTGEGDGIDSNGWITINGGEIIAQACSNSMDSGIDSDMGITINGGTVIATGNMLDRIETNHQNAVVFNFAQRQENLDGQGHGYYLGNATGDKILNYQPRQSFSILFYSSPELTAEEWSLWKDDKQLLGVAMEQGGMGGMMPDGPMGERPDRGQMPDGFEPGEMPNGFEPREMPEGFEPGETPEGFDPGKLPEDFDPAKLPEGFEPDKGAGRPGNFGPGGRQNISAEEATPILQIKPGTNNFYIFTDINNTK